MALQLHVFMLAICLLPMIAFGGKSSSLTKMAKRDLGDNVDKITSTRGCQIKRKRRYSIPPPLLGGSFA